MLLELRIQNYAIIERLVLRAGRGLSVLTGETGAGKSIIVGALSLLVGERASAETVRAGAERAVVEGVFDAARVPAAAAMLEEQGLELEDGLVILRREVAAEGRSRAWVNLSSVTAGFLGQLGGLLVDLHGQHESQSLLRVEEQRAILDAYAGAAELAARTRAAHARLLAARRALRELDARRSDIEQRASLLRFEVEEIEQARLREDEEAKLEEESGRLEHAEDLADHATRLHAELYAAEDSVSSTLADLRRTLDHLVRIDPAQEDARDLLETALHNAQELGRRMGEYAAGIDHDPGRLFAIRRRQDLIFRLKAKYGTTIADILALGVRARSELDLLDGTAFERKELEKEEAEAVAGLSALATELTAARRAAADRLAAEVNAVFPELGLGGAFSVALGPLAEIAADGAESVEFLVALNVGFDAKPLARVASGGELSRVMLALKTILARLDHVPTLVFDEVDVGIGGRVALQVADRLRRVGEHHQVFVITHLPQIASRAEHQLLVEKVVREGSTITRVSEVHDEDRVHELARMLGGDPESAASLEHARELLGTGAKAS
jgi:DNA repair protein RecN (Recombination protein N)